MEMKKALVFISLSLFVSCRTMKTLGDPEGRFSQKDKNEDLYIWFQKYNKEVYDPVTFGKGATEIRRADRLKGKLEKVFDNISSPTAIFSFVHLSDVQLREERVRLYYGLLTGLLDAIVPTNNFGELQEKYDTTYYMALIQGLNAELKNNLIKQGGTPNATNPLFMVHTGDAVHTSVLSEMYEFQGVTSLLELPWFATLGNHEVTSFGTPIGGISEKNPQMEFQPIGDHDDAISIFHPTVKTNFYEILGLPRLPAVDKFILFHGFAHGFDYTPGPKIDKKLTGLRSMESRGAVGYYSRVIDSGETDLQYWTAGRMEPGLKIRLIFLDTCESVESSSSGVMHDAQARWVAQEIEEAKTNNELIFAFGHHEFDANMETEAKFGIVKNSAEAMVRSAFSKYDHFVAYFCGHTHKQNIGFVPAADGKSGGFVQIIAPSILEYPKAGTIIHLYKYADAKETGRMIEVEFFTPGAQLPEWKFLSGSEITGLEERASRIIKINNPTPAQVKDSADAQTILCQDSADKDKAGSIEKLINPARLPVYRIIIPNK